MSNSIEGVIVAAHGRKHVVRGADGKRWSCHTRGRRSDAACGDRVRIEPSATDQAVIVEILPRQNLMYRSDAMRAKVLAANVTQLWIVVATDPAFSEDLLGRALVAAEVLKVPATILLNKIDLVEEAARARTFLAKYQALGYRSVEISVKGDPVGTRTRLVPFLTGQTTLLLGQSGMGKSTLLNLLVPTALAATREISEVLHSGKHTTTDARLYELPEGDAAVIDTPGFQEFGLAHLTPGEIERAFPEFATLLGHCKYYNCTHLIEPGCAVRAGVDTGAVLASRYQLFCALTRESTGAASMRRDGLARAR